MQYAGRRCRATTTARFFGHPQEGGQILAITATYVRCCVVPPLTVLTISPKASLSPKLSTALTLTWVLGRISYTRRYNSGRPEKRVSNLFFQTERNLMKRFSTKAWRNGPISPHGVRGRPVMGIAG